jgi:hypothetical protein
MLETKLRENAAGHGAGRARRTEEKKMTMSELQTILGEQIKAMVDGTADIEKAKAVAFLAKQMINNADIVLRADKFVNNKGRRIDKMVGDNES